MKLLRVILLTMTSFTAASAATTVQHSVFGHMPDGKPVELYTLKSPAVELQVTSFGARVVPVEPPRIPEGKARFYATQPEGSNPVTCSTEATILAACLAV